MVKIDCSAWELLKTILKTFIISTLVTLYGLCLAYLLAYSCSNNEVVESTPSPSIFMR